MVYGWLIKQEAAALRAAGEYNAWRAALHELQEWLVTHEGFHPDYAFDIPG